VAYALRERPQIRDALALLLVVALLLFAILFVLNFEVY
jgi:hypothetical protein